MSPDLRRLYLFHLFNGIAISIVGANLFHDRLFLHLGLNMAQLGAIKGPASFTALTTAFLLSPALARLRIDRTLVAVAYLIRVLLPFLFLLVPQFTRDPRILTAWFTVILTASLIFPFVAINSINVLCQAILKPQELGRQLSIMTLLLVVPGAWLAVPCSWYVDVRAQAGHEAFIKAYLFVFSATAIFQLPASWVMWRLSSPDPKDPPRAMKWQTLVEPFRSRRFRGLLAVVFILGTLVSMVGTFSYPYLMRAQGLTMGWISVLDGIIRTAGFSVAIVWGHLADRYGPRNVLRLCVFAVAIGVLCMGGQGWVFIIPYALLAWHGSGGLFGNGMGICTRVLTLSLADESRSHVSIAAAAFVGGCGALAGSVFGGVALEWLASRMHPALPFERYRIYFVFVGLAFLLTGSLIAAVRDGRRHLSRRAMVLLVYRSMRNRIGRLV